MRKREKYLLGFDIGSSFVKASLVEARTGKIVASAFSPKSEMRIISKRSGWAEQDPETWWNNCKTATREILSKSKINKNKIAAIGISYQMHGLVAVDKHLKALRPAIIWCDSRAVGIGEKAFSSIGKNLCLARCMNSPGNFTASKLKWVKDNEPPLYKKIYKIMLPGDYVAMKMTGQVKTTPSGLSEAILWDYEKGKAAGFVLKHFGISMDLLPDIVSTFSVQGRLNEDAARELNLQKGTVISYRAGDQPNNALSLNVLNPGEVAATCGTSGVVYGVAGKKISDQKCRVNTFLHVNHKKDDPRYGILLCLNGAGILNKWLKDNISDIREYDKMNRAASNVPAGSQGLSVIPCGNGAERTLNNRDIGASIHGLNFNIHTRAHVLRASQEGIAFAMNYGLDILKKLGVKIRKIRAPYSNLFLSPVFQEAFASVSGADIELYNTDGSAGAALGAGVGSGLYKSFAEAFRNLKKVKKIKPAGKNARLYRDAYGRWKKILNGAIEERSG